MSGLEAFSEAPELHTGESAGLGPTLKSHTCICSSFHCVLTRKQGCGEKAGTNDLRGSHWQENWWLRLLALSVWKAVRKACLLICTRYLARAFPQPPCWGDSPKVQQHHSKGVWQLVLVQRMTVTSSQTVKYRNNEWRLETFMAIGRGCGIPALIWGDVSLNRAKTKNTGLPYTGNENNSNRQKQHRTAIPHCS